MICGVISLIPRFGMETYVDSKTKNCFRHLPCTISGTNTNIFLTVKEDFYLENIKSIQQNSMPNAKKVRFKVKGEVKSINKISEASNLSNLYIRAQSISLMNDDEENINFFSISAHCTKILSSNEDSNLFVIAANKNIIKNDENKKKPSYALLKTPPHITLEEKDIINGMVRIIQKNNDLILDALHLVPYTKCKEICSIIGQTKLKAS